MGRLDRSSRQKLARTAIDTRLDCVRGGMSVSATVDGKRGTDSPIMVFEPGTPYHQYFDDQVRWFSQMASDAREPWVCKGLVVRPLAAADLAAANATPELLTDH